MVGRKEQKVSGVRDFASDVIAALKEKRAAYRASGLPVDDIDAELAAYGAPVTPPAPVTHPGPDGEQGMENKAPAQGESERAVPAPATPPAQKRPPAKAPGKPGN